MFRGTGHAALKRSCMWWCNLAWPPQPGRRHHRMGSHVGGAAAGNTKTNTRKKLGYCGESLAVPVRQLLTQALCWDHQPSPALPKLSVLNCVCMLLPEYLIKGLLAIHRCSSEVCSKVCSRCCDANEPSIVCQCACSQLHKSLQAITPGCALYVPGLLAVTPTWL